MVGGHIFAAVCLHHTSPRLFHTFHPEHFLHSRSAKENDHLGIHQFDLLEEIGRSAGQYFNCFWHSVIWGTTLHNVSNKEVRSVQSRALQNMVQVFARGTDERMPSPVFIPPRTFPNDHEFGSNAA